MSSVVSQVPSRRPRVMLVDDERHVLDGLAVFLEREVDVSMCTSAQEALERIEREPYDAVVSDLRMPGMDGIAFLGRVRAASPATGRVLLTGHADVEAAVAAVNGAAVHFFLTKPCPATEVARVLREVMAMTAGVRGDTLAKLGQQATLGAVAGSIGHEIGNLVMALGGSVSAVRQQMTSGAPLEAEDVEVLDLVRSRLADHARDLRELSKPRELAPVALDLRGVVSSALAVMRRTGLLRVARVELDLGASPAPAKADPKAIEGIVVNLLKNAAEALEQKVARSGLGREPSRIVLRVTTDGAFARVVVEDNADGIPPEVLERLFQPFQTTKGDRGNGIGLAFAMSTVKRLGGSIDVETEQGRGTRFTVSFPVAA